MLGMLPQSKKIATMILQDASNLKAQETPELTPDMAFEDAAGKILNAIESKDKKALIQGFKDMYMLIDAIEDKAEEQQEEYGE